MNKEEKLKQIKIATDILEKNYGENTVMRLSDKPATDVDVISTGSLKLDIALGIGGLPKGRIVEIYGPESSGKTTLALHIIAEAQKKGGMCAIIDAEHSLDVGYAKNLGVNVEDVYINQPDYGEQGLEVADKLIESGSFDVILIDSVAALVPKAELEGEMGESKMGLHARLMSQALRKLVGSVSKTNTLLIFINQLRDKIGVMYGNPETTTGGNGLKFYASVRLDVRRSLTAENSVMEGKEKIGNKTTVKVVKNKVAPPFKQADFNIIYNVGIDKLGEFIEVGKDLEILKKRKDSKSGIDMVTYNDIKYPINEFEALIRDNEDFKAEISAKIKEKL